MPNVTSQPEERARSYKKLEEDAIALARESRWEEAAENRYSCPRRARRSSEAERNARRQE